MVDHSIIAIILFIIFVAGDGIYHNELGFPRVIRINNIPRLQMEPSNNSPKLASNLPLRRIVKMIVDTTKKMNTIRTPAPIENAPNMISGINAPVINQATFNHLADTCLKHK